MKYILWWQDQHFHWHRYQEQYGHTSAYNTALKRANSTGKKYKITDGDGRLLDLVEP